jgi:hypothetical protein
MMHDIKFMSTIKWIDIYTNMDGFVSAIYFDKLIQISKAFVFLRMYEAMK